MHGHRPHVSEYPVWEHPVGAGLRQTAIVGTAVLREAVVIRPTQTSSAAWV
jgi:hypothetical protein